MPSGSDEMALGRAALVCYAATGVVLLGTAAVSPVLPAIQSAFGVSDSSIGLAMTAFTVTIAVTVAPLGWLADRIGRRPVIGTSLFVFGISGLGAAVAPSFEVLLILRGIQGIGFAGTLPMVVTVVGDLFDEDTEIAAHGYRVTAANFAAFVFPVITGELSILYWGYPFLLYAIAFPLGVAVFLWLPEAAGDVEPTEGNYARAVMATARRPVVAAAVVVSFVRYFVLFAMYAYLPLLVISQELTAGQAGAVVGAINGAKMVVASQTHRYTAAGSPRVLVMAAVAASGLTIAAFSIVESFPLFVAVAALMGACGGVASPLQKAILTRYSPVNVRAGLISFNAIGQNIGKSSGPIAIGVAVVYVSLPEAFVALGAATTVVAVVLLGTVVVFGHPPTDVDLEASDADAGEPARIA